MVLSDMEDGNWAASFRLRLSSFLGHSGIFLHERGLRKENDTQGKSGGSDLVLVIHSQAEELTHQG